MADERGSVAERQELVDVIGGVRRRWRTRLWLRGAIVALGGALAVLILASWGLQISRFSPGSIIGLRLFVFAAFAGLIAFWFLVPLRRRATDLQVALYIEEHEPSLQAAVLSAVDAGATGGSVADGSVPQPILDRMIAQAADRCRESVAVREVGRRAVRRSTVVLGTLAAVAALLLSVGPEFFRQGASALLVLSRDAEAASPYAISVEPGDVTIPKGADQILRARLAGFRAIDVTAHVKPDGAAEYQGIPLVAGGSDAAFEGMLFDVSASADYYVESDGVRSATHRLTVVELPAVETLELEYVYPEYTGLAPQRVESGGDVAALEGTQVRVRVTPTMASPAGRLQLEPGTPEGLAVQADGTLTGAFTISADGYYHVELDGPNGEQVAASPKFTVDVIDDRDPTVSFEKPRNDIRANALEEVFLQARADDDYGVRHLELVYSINGGEEQRVSLHRTGAAPLTEVSAGHTVYMEELGVQQGDFVSYYAQATDTDTVSGPKSATSDIYFIEVRPFSQEFRRAQSMAGAMGGGGGGGGGGGDQAFAMSEQQRQIISATFNLERDREKIEASKFSEDAVFVGLSQARLREQVDELVGQMTQRLGGASENLRRIAELLPQASEHMATAEEALEDLGTKDALAAEQRALQVLQQAEQLYDLEVQMQGGGGGGGGGGGSQASELADLFQLELDRMANQYELQQSAQQQGANAEVDEVANRLRDLARRQLEAAAQAARLQQGQQGGAAGSASQRALADEAEQAARQLEQLRREAERQGQQRQDLADAARRLQEAADSMRQAAATGSDGGAQARQAAERLQQAQRLLEESRTDQAEQTADQAARRAEELAQRQRELAAGVEAMNSQQGQERIDRMNALAEEKDELRQGVEQLEQELGSLGRQALADDQRDAARRFQEAAGAIRGEAIKEIIDYSKQAMAGGPRASTPVEQRLTESLDELRDRVNRALEASREAERGDGMSQAAQQAASLTRGLNSLQEQMRQAGEQGQGQEGEQGQGQQGEQGQQGQQGQGQQGQGQEEGQGQGQGQQGEGQGQQGQGEGQGQQGQGQQGQGQGQGGGDGRGGQDRLGPNTGGPLSADNVGGDARAGSGGGGYDARQWRNTAGQLTADAQQLRRQLQESGGTAEDLRAVDEVLRSLREMSSGSDGTPTGLNELSVAALERIRRLEFDLRQRTDTTSDELYLAGRDAAPVRYRALVDEYFRALSEQQ